MVSSLVYVNCLYNKTTIELPCESIQIERTKFSSNVPIEKTVQRYFASEKIYYIIENTSK